MHVGWSPQLARQYGVRVDDSCLNFHKMQFSRAGADRVWKSLPLHSVGAAAVTASRTARHGRAPPHICSAVNGQSHAVNPAPGLSVWLWCENMCTVHRRTTGYWPPPVAPTRRNVCGLDSCCNSVTTSYIDALLSDFQLPAETCTFPQCPSSDICVNMSTAL